MADPVFRAGDLVSIAGAFATPAGVPTDPTGLVFTFAVIEAASGNILVGATSYTFPDSHIVHDGAGAYHISLDTTGNPGRWVYSWVAIGIVQSVSDGDFLVRQPLANAAQVGPIFTGSVFQAAHVASLIVDGNGTFGGTLGVTGLATFSGGLTVSAGAVNLGPGGVTIAAGGLTVSAGAVVITAGTLTLNNTLTVNGNASIASGGALTVANGITVTAGGLTVTGNAIFGGPASGTPFSVTVTGIGVMSLDAGGIFSTPSGWAVPGPVYFDAGRPTGGAAAFHWRTNNAGTAVMDLSGTGQLTVANGLTVSAGGASISGTTLSLASATYITLNDSTAAKYIQVSAGNLQVYDAAFSNLLFQIPNAAPALIKNGLNISSGGLTVSSGGAALTGDVTMSRGAAFWAHAVVASQPGIPATLADVIAIIRGCGLSA